MGLYPRVMRGLTEKEVSASQGPEPPFNTIPGYSVIPWFKAGFSSV